MNATQIQISRRTWLSFGLIPLLAGSASGMSLPKSAMSSNKKSCILVWLGGGASHMDTWDPKPSADLANKGEFKAISSSIPGVYLSEVLPNMARVLDQTVLIRSLTSPEAEHERASHHILTGWRPSPATVYPTAGSVYSKMFGTMSATLPNQVAIPNQSNFAGSGYLGNAYDPLEISGDPSQPNFRVRDLSPPDRMTYERLLRRRAMVDQLDSWSDSGKSAATESRKEFDRQTYDLLTSQATQKAFRVQDESDSTREMYGRNPLGQSLLLARRLIERGVGYVTINDRNGGLGWDTHVDNFNSLRDRLVPPLDQGLAALIQDLNSRGLLEDTLVIACGEFGRTPKINPNAGRDHHSRANSMILAGTGLKSGMVLGETDRNAMAPIHRPVTPAEVSATVFHLLGIDLNSRLISPDGRPIPLVDRADVIREILL